MDEDLFFNIRKSYYIGDYAGVEKEAKNNLSNLSGTKAKERDAYLCRAYIAQNKFKKAQSVSGKTVATPLLAVKQLSIFKQATSVEEKELVIETLKGYLEEESVVENVTFCVVTAQIFVECAMFKEALQLVVKSNNLEKLLMQVQIYLKISRPDLAAKSFSRMQELEDDDPLTTLANIGLCLFHGGSNKVRDAVEYIEELCNTNADTVLLKNMQAVCSMHLGNYTEAWKLCKVARDLAKKNGTETVSATLINSIVCLQHLNKGQDLLPKLLNQLKASYPNHPFIKQNEEMEKLFDRSAQNFKI